MMISTHDMRTDVCHDHIIIKLCTLNFPTFDFVDGGFPIVHFSQEALGGDDNVITYSFHLFGPHLTTFMGS